MTPCLSQVRSPEPQNQIGDEVSDPQYLSIPQPQHGVDPEIPTSQSHRLPVTYWQMPQQRCSPQCAFTGLKLGRGAGLFLVMPLGQGLVDG